MPPVFNSMACCKAQYVTNTPSFSLGRAPLNNTRLMNARNGSVISWPLPIEQNHIPIFLNSGWKSAIANSTRPTPFAECEGNKCAKLSRVEERLPEVCDRAIGYLFSDLKLALLTKTTLVLNQYVVKSLAKSNGPCGGEHEVVSQRENLLRFLFDCLELITSTKSHRAIRPDDGPILAEDADDYSHHSLPKHTVRLHFWEFLVDGRHKVSKRHTSNPTGQITNVVCNITRQC